MTLDEIYAPVKADLELVETRLAQIAGNDIPLLSEMLEYALLNAGKRVRPAVTLLSGQFHNYDSDMLVPIAAAVELLHIGTLVHDDIIDKSALRRGKPAVYRKWGLNSALLLGDYLFSRAGTVATTTENMRVIKRFTETLMTISGGELREASVSFEPQSARDNYYKWIGDKTACLFVMATECGSVLSGCSEDEVQALKEYALNFGLAFQIVDDILDFVGDEKTLGKPIGSDLSEGAITLPTILYAEKHPDDRLIHRVIIERDGSQVAQVVERIKASTAIDECRAIAGQFHDKASQSLDKLPECEARTSLKGLVAFVIERNK